MQTLKTSAGVVIAQADEFIYKDSARCWDNGTGTCYGDYNKEYVVVIVPKSVAMWQARDVLIAAGLLAPINAFLASIPDLIAREKAQAKFEYSNTVQRDDPLLATACAALGMTDAQLDALFIAAAAL